MAAQLFHSYTEHLDGELGRQGWPGYVPAPAAVHCYTSTAGITDIPVAIGLKYKYKYITYKQPLHVEPGRHACIHAYKLNPNCILNVYMQYQALANHLCPCSTTNQCYRCSLQYAELTGTYSNV